MEKTFVVTYKGGKGKGYATTEKLVKAQNKTEAKNIVQDLIPGSVIKKVETL